MRFEANGDSRKDVHTRVRINSELGVRQFSHLNFDFNRSFEQIEIPLVHITHASGGTADILPSAITDQPNPAVADRPAYQDVRVKSVRILGLAPADILEYRVVTTTTHHPLAPDFWLEHSFDRTGVVSHELYELNLPASRQVQMHINPGTPPDREKSEPPDSNRVNYRWDLKPENLTDHSSRQARSKRRTRYCCHHVYVLGPTKHAAQIISKQCGFDIDLGRIHETDRLLEGTCPRYSVLYDLVRAKIKTVDLPLDFSKFP